jgi:hypothetical protein
VDSPSGGKNADNAVHRHFIGVWAAHHQAGIMSAFFGRA